MITLPANGIDFAQREVGISNECIGKGSIVVKKLGLRVGQSGKTSWLLRVLTLGVLGSGISISASAQEEEQAAPEGFLSADDIEGLSEYTLNPDGTAQLVLENGQTVTIEAAQLQIINGQVYVLQTAVDAAGLSAATGSGLTMVGGIAAAGGGIAAAAGGGGGGGSGTSSGNTAPAPVDNTAPTFTSSTSASVSENQTSAYDADATDAEGDTVTYSLSGGADAALFDIDASTGEVTFKSAPDFEAPGDDDGDNVYEVEITASDGTNSDGTVRVDYGDKHQ